MTTERDAVPVTREQVRDRYAAAALTVLDGSGVGCCGPATGSGRGCTRRMSR